mgnify:CR=1 FL=1
MAAIGLAVLVTLSGVYMLARPRIRLAAPSTIDRVAFPVGMLDSGRIVFTSNQGFGVCGYHGI